MILSIKKEHALSAIKNINDFFVINKNLLKELITENPDCIYNGIAYTFDDSTMYCDYKSVFEYVKNFKMSHEYYGFLCSKNNQIDFHDNNTYVSIKVLLNNAIDLNALIKKYEIDKDELLKYVFYNQSMVFGYDGKIDTCNEQIKTLYRAYL